MTNLINFVQSTTNSSSLLLFNFHKHQSVNLFDSVAPITNQRFSLSAHSSSSSLQRKNYPQAISPSMDVSQSKAVHGLSETVVGVLGGGQLGRMLCEAASEMAIKVVVLDPMEKCPASAIAHDHMLGSYSDSITVAEFAKSLAEPMDELKKSYEQFLYRVVNHKNKKTQCTGRMVKKVPQIIVNVPAKLDNSERTKGNVCMTGEQAKGILLDGCSAEMQHHSMNNQTKALPGMNDGEVCSGSLAEKGTLTGLGCKNYYKEIELETNKLGKFYSDDTAVARFVDKAIMGKSNTEEDAWHHGLVEPTINTKEAMLAINSMFQEPLEPPLTGRRRRNHLKTDESSNCGFEVFVDENLDDNVGIADQDVAKHSVPLQSSTCGTAQPSLQHFQIFIDDEESNDKTKVVDSKYEMDHPKGPESNHFFSPNSENLPLEASQDHTKKPHDSRNGEDTVIYRFVGSTITDEPLVENACHHGLVEPTVNLKEAMDDINSMFGKPIEFVRKSRKKKEEKPPGGNSNTGGFLILPDDTIDCLQENSKPGSSTNKGSDLFEQTVCTKEAMVEINNLFKMPLDF